MAREHPLNHRWLLAWEEEDDVDDVKLDSYQDSSKLLLTVRNERWLKRKARYACGTAKHTVNNISVYVSLFGFGMNGVIHDVSNILLMVLSHFRYMISKSWRRRTLLKRNGGRRVMVRVVIRREVMIKLLWLREVDPTMSSTAIAATTTTARIKRSGCCG